MLTASHAGPLAWRRAALGVLSSIALFGTTSAGHAENLVDALSLSYANNPRLMAQRASLRATDEQFPQAISGHRPTASVSVEAGKTGVTSSGTALSRSANLSPASTSATITQPIFRGLRTLYDSRRANASIEQARANLTSTEQDILFETVSAYMNVVRDVAVLRLNVNNEQVLRRQLRATRDRFQVGDATRTDVSQSQARLAEATATRVQSEGQLQVSRANYRRVVGRMPGKLIRPKKRLVLPKTLAGLISVATRRAPGVVAARYAELAARNNVKSIAGELLPTISLNGSLSRAHETTLRNGRSDTGSITASVVIPLYQAGLVSSRVREAKQLVSQRHQDIIESRRVAVEAANQTWAVLQTARAQIKAFESGVRANTIALNGVRQEQAAGLRTVLDVLNAEQELLDSRVSLVRAQRDEVVAEYDVWRSMGRLTAQNLRLPVQIYDPSVNYKRVKYKPFGLSAGDGTRAK